MSWVAKGRVWCSTCKAREGRGASRTRIVANNDAATSKRNIVVGVRLQTGAIWSSSPAKEAVGRDRHHGGWTTDDGEEDERPSWVGGTLVPLRRLESWLLGSCRLETIETWYPYLFVVAWTPAPAGSFPGNDPSRSCATTRDRREDSSSRDDSLALELAPAPPSPSQCGP